MADVKQLRQEVDSREIADVSSETREAIPDHLQTPEEQLTTMIVHGKVVNLEQVHLPNRVEINQTIMCDNMPMATPSSVEFGPTSRSISRSYANAISKLVPSQSALTVSTPENRAEGLKRYKEAMAYLSATVPGSMKKGGMLMTVMELYTAKQEAYAKVVDHKNAVFEEELEKAQTLHKDPTEAQEAYVGWVQAHSAAYRNYVQAAYMDWVVAGRKAEVEFWIGVVGQDSNAPLVE